MTSRYDEVYTRWSRDPEAFWASAADGIDWYRRWDTVLDSSRAPFHSWFVGGLVNTCHNALDRHIEGGRAIRRVDAEVCQGYVVPSPVKVNRYLAGLGWRGTPSTHGKRRCNLLQKFPR